MPVIPWILWMILVFIIMVLGLLIHELGARSAHRDKLQKLEAELIAVEASGDVKLVLPAVHALQIYINDNRLDDPSVSGGAGATYAKTILRAADRAQRDTFGFE